MERRRVGVLSTNLNVLALPEFASLPGKVASWEWISGREAAARERLTLDAAWDLRRFDDPLQLAESYVAGKRLFPSTFVGVARAMWWILRQVRRRDVVFAAPPSALRDRILWAEAISLAALLRRRLSWYSEDWILPTGRRNRVARLRVRVLSSLATEVLVPSHLHEAFHSELRGTRPGVRLVASLYNPPAGSEPARSIRKGTVNEPARLLFVGRPMALKGLDRAIWLAQDAVARGAYVHLRIVLGKSGQFAGSEPRYFERCRRQLDGLERTCWELADEVDDIEDELAAADLLLAPNRVITGDKVPAESWGRVVEEARLAGLPVLATDAVPAAVALLTDEIYGRVVPWRSDELLREALWEMLGGA